MSLAINPAFKKSTYSTASGPNCVEVALLDAAVVVRDSKDPTGAVLRFTTAEWIAFVRGARDGEFDITA